MKLFEFEHNKHGKYFVWYCDGCYGISKEDKKPFCAYSSLSELFKMKGF